MIGLTVFIYIYIYCIYIYITACSYISTKTYHVSSPFFQIPWSSEFFHRNSKPEASQVTVKHRSMGFHGQELLETLRKLPRLHSLDLAENGFQGAVFW